MSTSFNESLFEKKLLQLRETHESISNLSAWCLTHQTHHSKIISIWLNVLKRVKIEHRLLLFYLANDVIQYSRRKHLPFVEAFAPALQKATTMVREDSVKNKVLRLFKIWDDRGIYDEAFLLDLSGLLICDPKGGNRMDIQDFQPTVMYSRIRSCKKLEDDTDLKLKVLNESALPLTNVDQLRKTLKDREHGEDVMEDVEMALSKIKAYVDALEVEIKERSGLLDMLDTGEQYYDKDFREAKIVVNAYKCFSQRVRQVQKKLDEKTSSLPSPMPSPPDVNAPSPSPSMSPDDNRSISEFNASSFTMGESFINNSSIIEKALDSQDNSFYNEGQNYYIPPVYNPSMTTGHSDHRSRDQAPYNPSLNNTTISQYNSADTSFNSQYSSNDNSYIDTMNNTGYNASDDHYISRANLFNNDSQLSNNSEQSYSAEYFIGANSTDSAPYDGERGKRRCSDERKSHMDSNMFSSLMDSSGGLLPPPPPPPPPPKSPSDHGENEEKKIEVIGSSLKQPSFAEILETLMAKKEIKTETPGPLKPPPMPPTGLHEEENWEPEEWDAPLSPSPFQDFPPSDTDMRPKDIDHRNLISLTGGDQKTPEESLQDKDERRMGSSFLDSDSSDSRSPPDHIPPLNLPQLNIPPSSLPPPSLDFTPTQRSPMNNPPPSSHPLTNSLLLMPPPDFDNYNDKPLTSILPSHGLDNVENIDMEMSDEEDKRETSPMAVRVRPGLVPITPEPENNPPPKLLNVGLMNHSLPPPPSPNLSLMNVFHGAPPPRMPLLDTPPPMDSPRGPRPPRMMSPDHQWLPPPPTYSPHPPPRPPHFMLQPPRQPFFHHGHRPFRPRHFRPRFQPRW